MTRILPSARLLRSARLPNERAVHLLAVTGGFPKPFYVAVANLKVERKRRYNAGAGQYFDDRARADRFFDILVTARTPQQETCHAS